MIRFLYKQNIDLSNSFLFILMFINYMKTNFIHSKIYSWYFSNKIYFNLHKEYINYVNNAKF